MGIGFADVDGRTIKANRVFCDMVGNEPGKLAGLKTSDVTHAGDVENTERNRLQTIDKEKSYYRLEKRNVRKDGGMIWAQVTSMPVFDGDGQFLYAMAAAGDGAASARASMSPTT